jgi:predicted amidohydrolase YtcJ
MLFYNGVIFDGYRFLPVGTIVRVRDGKIAEVGVSRAGKADIIDLGGGTLLPGFIDAHVHPVFAGDQLRRCDLSDVDSRHGYLDHIAAYAQAHPGAAWVTGGGWSMDAFPRGVPAAADLDAIVPDLPVFLTNRDGHGAWVNSKALKLAGIDAATPDPADGRIERDATGQPVGMLQEGAAGLVSRLLPATTEADWDQALLAGQARLLSFGITGWQDAIVGHAHKSGDPLPAYLRAAQDGSLLANVVGALWWDRDRGLEQLPGLLDCRSAGQEGRFRPTSVKMMLDGVAENHTAAMLEPYLDSSGCQTDIDGLDFIDPGQLSRYVTVLDREGFQVHFHALGDRAVRLALDAVAAAHQANGDTGNRHHLAHVQVVHPDDIRRFAEVSATANIQPLWAAHEPQMDELTIPFLGERRASWQYPFRSLQAAGAKLCAGSDWPVSSPDPLLGAHVAVTRTAPGAHPYEDPDPFLPEQRLDLASILAAYTSGSARINGLESVTGAIGAGLDADFAVVDADLSHIADHEIGTAAVAHTWIRGQLVYHRGRIA